MNSDILIAGAGCAGLSLAVHLLEQGVDRRIVVVDPRTTFERDRTWCFWRVGAHPFERCVTHRWNRWRVSYRSSPGERREVVSSSTSHPYEHIPADLFYEFALGRLESAPNVELRLGESIDDLRPTNNGVEAVLGEERFEVDLAFDARGYRPTTTAANGSGLHQVFGGSFVQTNEPVFDRDTVTLMDFRHSAEAIRFAYLLPFSETEALVEDTWITPAPGPYLRSTFDAGIESHLERLGVRDFVVRDTERGVIPMISQRRSRRTTRLLHLGLGGSDARPSSGYAFLGIQRRCRRIAETVSRGQLPTEQPPRRTRADLLDRIFLSYLARRPECAPELFFGLFERTPPDSLVRFLADEESIADDFRVLMAMPRRAMMLEAFRSLVPPSTPLAEAR